MLNPIKIVKELEDKYRDYLNSQFTFRNADINEAASIAIRKESELIHGPYIESATPYMTGRSMVQLVSDGVLNKGINRAVTQEEFEIYKRYKHQEKAFEKILANENVVISSGTGSGKTECFLYPVISALLDEKDAGTLGSGVRAMLVYPMNALANDQMDRLRSSLSGVPEITFARYIGETEKSDRKKAIKVYKENNNNEAPLKNELLTREEIHSNPPNILVTNYAMLEYMLLRPEVNTLFQGKNSDSFRYIILDEAHTYKGAHGAEVSMLIRRLKERIFKKSEDCLTCIATSATLSTGTDAAGEVAEFASSLFSEKFKSENIVFAEKVQLEEGANISHSIDTYGKLLVALNHGNTKELIRLLNVNYDDIQKALYDFFFNDALATFVRKVIIKDIYTIDQVAEMIDAEGEDEKVLMKKIIVDIINLGAEVIDVKTGMPMINAKYHVFARSLEGGFVCFYPKVKVLTERHRELDGANVYELMNCIKCGQEYILARIENDKYGNNILFPANLKKGGEFVFMLSGDENEKEFDEDEIEITDSNKKLQTFELCPKCSKLYPAGVKTPDDCCGVQFVNMKLVSEHGGKRECSKCCKRREGILKKMITGEDASTITLTKSLYQLMPDDNSTVQPQQKHDWWGESEEVESKFLSGKKLLVFSDSRQDAAKFAVGIQSRYDDLLWKKLIYEIVNESEYRVSYDELVQKTINRADKHGLLCGSESYEDKTNMIRIQVIKEFVEFEQRMSLVNLGMIDIQFDIDEFFPPNMISALSKEFDFTELETKKIIKQLFNSIRRQYAVELPDEIDYKDDEFEGRNLNYAFKRQGSENGHGKYCVGWLPSDKGRTNMRTSYLTRVFNENCNSDDESREKAVSFLSRIYDIDNRFTSAMTSRQFLIQTSEKWHKLNRNKWYFAKQDNPINVCNKCGAVTYVNVRGVCPQTNCDGRLFESADIPAKNKFYRAEYVNARLIPMQSEEHTAQLSSSRATKLQKQFKAGKVNILSCSTTFEMGVDIGSLETVVLRNVPPSTANYVQRAGRAGRRNSSAALILTFARRRSHDLTYFNDPTKMIKGEIISPYLDTENIYIIRRHIHSIVMAWFFLGNSNYYSRNAKSLFEDDDKEDANVLLKKLLDAKPNDLYMSIKTAIPKSLHKKLDIDNWGWVKYLVGDDSTESSLDNAMGSHKLEIKELNDMLAEFRNNEKISGKSIDYLQSRITTVESIDMVSFLSKGGVIPRYGFPVDVVALALYNPGNSSRKDIELDRDLRMAITEYAPGAVVVAGKQQWRPYALKTLGSKKWPTYDVAICKKCNRIYSNQTVLGEPYTNAVGACCNLPLSYVQMVKPIFGFTTKKEIAAKGKKATGDANHYNSMSFFEGFSDGVKKQEQKAIIGAHAAKLTFAPQGKMLVMNLGIKAYAGQGIPFKICSSCGYVHVKKDYPKDYIHQSPNGKDCTNKLHPAFLGHTFYTDAIVITTEIKADMDLENYSYLYAMVEGACKSLDIDRREINGCLYGLSNNSISIVIFDTVPGGAGHAHKILGNIGEVFAEALNKVSGQCGCGEETSCYGCLRNYDNQSRHEDMSRGSAKNYLEWLIYNK